MADDVGLVDFQRVHHRDHVVAGDVLLYLARLRHVGRRIPALAKGDAGWEREKCRICGSSTVVAGIFMHEDDGEPWRLFVI